MLSLIAFQCLLPARSDPHGDRVTVPRGHTLRHGGMVRAGRIERQRDRDRHAARAEQNDAAAAAAAAGAAPPAATSAPAALSAAAAARAGTETDGGRGEAAKENARAR